MTDASPPKIEFPCVNYPIKIMADSSEEFRSFAMEVISRNAPDFDTNTVAIRPSRNGRFEAITVRITATGTDQLSKIFEELKAHPSLRMVL